MAQQPTDIKIHMLIFNWSSYLPFYYLDGVYNISFCLQHYITGAANTSVDGKLNTTIAGFPRFEVTDGEEELGFLSYGGYMVGDTDKSLGRYGIHFLFFIYAHVPIASHCCIHTVIKTPNYK